MICNEAEYQGAQRELQYLKDFLTQVEHAPDEPHNELTIIGIYKKMYHVWEELEEYYRARLAQMEPAKGTEKPREVVPVAGSKNR
jgi:hypothetical protein